MFFSDEITHATIGFFLDLPLRTSGAFLKKWTNSRGHHGRARERHVVHDDEQTLHDVLQWGSQNNNSKNNNNNNNNNSTIPYCFS